MRVITKKNRQAFLLSITSAALAVLTVLAILLATLLVVPTASGTTEPPEIIEGLEALYGNMAIAYPRVEEADITLVNVIRPATEDRGVIEYVLQRQESDKKDDKGNPVSGSFALFYRDDAGEMQSYYPPIADPLLPPLSSQSLSSTT